MGDYLGHDPAFVRMAARETVGTLSEKLVRERKAAIVSHIEGEIIISRPVEKVCDFVADERDEPRYNLRIISLVGWRGRRQEQNIWGDMERLLERGGGEAHESGRSDVPGAR